jgi:hypothetical protein
VNGPSGFLSFIVTCFATWVVPSFCLILWGVPRDRPLLWQLFEAAVYCLFFSVPVLIAATLAYALIVRLTHKPLLSGICGIVASALVNVWIAVASGITIKPYVAWAIVATPVYLLWVRRQSVHV